MVIVLSYWLLFVAACLFSHKKIHVGGVSIPNNSKHTFKVKLTDTVLDMLAWKVQGNIFLGFTVGSLKHH